MKKSAGFAIFNKEGKILILKGTNLRHYDLPKGRIEEDETMLEAAIRETKEEVNADVKPTIDKIFHCIYPDRQKEMFVYVMKDFDDSNYEFKCTSMFVNVHGKKLPETAFVEWVDPEVAISKLHKTASKIVKEIVDFFK